MLYQRNWLFDSFKCPVKVSITKRLLTIAFDLHFESIKSKPVANAIVGMKRKGKGSDEQVKKVPITAADGKVAGGCRVDASFNIYPVCWLY